VHKTREKHGAEPAKLLTRTETAKRLGMSTSTVRRYERDKLQPIRGADGVNRFDAKAVAELAASLLNDNGGKPPRKPRRNAAAAAPDVKRTEGEIAAEVFDRLEQRQSLAEIVVGVRVPPDVVRELHRQWQLGLIEGELERDKPVLPVGEVLTQQERHVSQRELHDLLASLPAGPTRLSIARDLGADFETGSGSTRHLVELGGFLVFGPATIKQIVDRYGGGAFRITAYGLEPRGLRWEVLAQVVT
jgi:transcriptional regulator with XRE-family HTH domain